MGKLRVNFGNYDWHVDMRMSELEDLLLSKSEWVRLPVFFGDESDGTKIVRSSAIRYYYEEL